MDQGGDELIAAMEATRAEARYDADRADGWSNPLLGFGTEKDPSVFTTFSLRPELQDPTLEAMYVQDHFSATCVEALPNHALRAGWDLYVPGDPKRAAEIRDAYATREEELGVVHELAKGSWWGRVFGGALGWIGADDGRPQYLPLREDLVKSIKFIHTFDRRNVTIWSYYSDPSHPKYRRPEIFLLQPRVIVGAGNKGGDGGSLGGALTFVHESRCIVWPGQPTTDTRREQRQGWDDSIFERLWEPLKQAGEDFAGKSLVLNRAAQTVIAIDDFYGKISKKDGKEAIKFRLSLLDQSRSRMRLLPIDTKERIENITQALAGVPEVVRTGVLRLSSASGIPASILLEGSSGDASDENEQENWDRQGNQWRELVLRKPHERVAHLILLSKNGPVGGVEPEQWKIKYRPLRIAPPKKRAEVSKIEAETDSINIEKGVYTADVAAARYGADGTTRIVMDESELAVKKKRREQLENQPPKDNAELGTVGARAEAAASLIEKVASGQLHRDSAQALLVELFRFTDDVAEKILGPADFKAAAPPPKSPGPPPDPKSGQGAGTPPNLPGFNQGGRPTGE